MVAVTTSTSDLPFLNSSYRESTDGNFGAKIPKDVGGIYSNRGVGDRLSLSSRFGLPRAFEEEVLHRKKRSWRRSLTSMARLPLALSEKLYSSLVKGQSQCTARGQI